MAEKNALITPQSLDKWRDFFHRLELPIDPSIKTTVLQKLNTRTANANNIATIIKQDPALCLLLMHEANKSLALSRNETSSLSHTLSLLGFPRIATLIRRAPDYNERQFLHLNEYRQQLNISLHAAHQAEAWAALNPHWQQHDVFWAALFYRAPLWALWYHAGDKMQALQKDRADHLGAANSASEQQLLGTTIQALSASMTRHWKLPRLTQQSWNSTQRGKARHWVALSRLTPENAHIEMEKMPRLQQIVSHPAFIICLSNRLADQAEWDWHSRKTTRLHKIFAAAMSYGIDQTVAISHQHAVEASRIFTNKNILSPAQQLLSFYRKADDVHSRKPLLSKQSPPTVTPQPQKKVAREPLSKAQSASHLDKPKPATQPSTESVTPPEDMDTLVKRLQEEPRSFATLHDIMNSTLATLCQHIQFERASASLLVTGKKELRTFYSHGAKDSPALRQFCHALKRGDLFNKLLQKPASLRLQSSNYTKVWPQLPGSFKQACGGVDEFFMMTVFSNTKPVALIYTDNGHSNRPMTDYQYTQFKILCKALSLCLGSLTT